MINKKLAVAALAAVASTVALMGGAQAQGRDQIRIVGSSTVFPFTSAVAETFGRGGKFKTPVVEFTGTGGGIKQFCAGVGVGHPDLANASRRIKKSELEGCAANGVTAVSELKWASTASSSPTPRARAHRLHDQAALAGARQAGRRQRQDGRQPL